VVTSGDTGGSVAVGCIDAAAASGSTSAGGKIGSCAGSSGAGSSAAGAGFASADTPVAGGTSGSARVGCIDAAAASGPTAAGASAGSCRGANGAAAGATGDTTAAVRVGACPQTQEQSPNSPTTPGTGELPGADGPADGPLPGSDVLGANASDDGGILAALTSGELPLTGLPLLPVLVAAAVSLLLGFALERRRARQAMPS
jgi:hypothetical protein